MATVLSQKNLRESKANAAFVRAGRDWLRRRGGSAVLRDALLEMTARQFAIPSSALTCKFISADVLDHVRDELCGPDSLFDIFTFNPDEALSDPGSVTPAALGDLYEATLPDRRRGGVYYTPDDLVRFICRDALDAARSGERGPATESLPPLRIVDPACGCGAFLVGMHLVLEDLMHEPGRPRSPLLPPVKLVGVDLDPVALKIAEYRLAIRRQLTAPRRRPELMEAELIVGDSLEPDRIEPFDIVIGNPPYGTKAPRAVRDRFFPAGEGSQSRDMYGLFIARALELLRPSGSLSFVVSDTWRTIKQHRPLRRRLLTETTIRHVIDLPDGVFDAAVNTTILTLTNEPPTDQHRLISVDVRGGARSRFLSDATKTDSSIATKRRPLQFDGVRHAYSQELPQTYDTCPVFSCSESLFTRLTDPSLARLGDAARVVQGLATGDNRYFVRRAEDVRGSYGVISRSEILTDDEIRSLSPREKLEGVDPNRYGGRCFVPYDKGGQNHTRQGLLANYYGPIDYFIDWSRQAVARLRTRRSDRQSGRIASRFQNADCYFVPGITWSDVGFYSPTFRLSGSGVFDVKGSRIIPHVLDRYYLLGLLCSLPVRFFVKVIANHTVSTQVEDIRRIPLPVTSEAVRKKIRGLVLEIIDRRRESRQPYADIGRETTMIDDLVARMYRLTEREVDEIRSWYRRRYPALSRPGN